MKYPFHFKAHITELEMRAGFSMLKWRTRSQSNIHTKFLHLYDSAVSIAVSAKPRTSSKKLQRVITRIDALELAACLHPVYGFVRSEWNPADKPSREFEDGSKT